MMNIMPPPSSEKSLARTCEHTFMYAYKTVDKTDATGSCA